MTLVRDLLPIGCCTLTMDLMFLPWMFSLAKLIFPSFFQMLQATLGHAQKFCRWVKGKANDAIYLLF